MKFDAGGRWSTISRVSGRARPGSSSGKEQRCGARSRQFLERLPSSSRPRSCSRPGPPPAPVGEPPQRRGRSSSPPTRPTRPTSSSAPTATPSSAWTPTSRRRSAPCSATQGQGRQRDLRHDHPGPRLRQVRPRDVVVHRHEGAREDGRLRHLLLRRHVVLREGAAAADDQRPRRPLRPLGRGGARDDAGGPTRPRRTRSARRPASPA